MKKIHLVFILLIGITINANSQSVFIKETHHVEIEYHIRVAVLFDGKFYCLREGYQIFTLTPKTLYIDTSLNIKSARLKFTDLYVHHDTLFARSDFDTYYLNKNHAWRIVSRNQREINYLYEDERFIVTSSCSGEWGGSIYFTDKETKQKYECQCTCAINVQKLDSAYIIAARSSGYSYIFKIADPLKLKKYDRSYLKGKKVIYVGDDESKSSQGAELLVKLDVTIIGGTITYNGKNYYLGEKLKVGSFDTIGNKKRCCVREVSIDTIGNKKLEPVENLTSLNIYDLGGLEIRTSNDHQIATFSNWEKTGFIDINKNKLSFYFFDIKHK